MPISGFQFGISYTDAGRTSSKLTTTDQFIVTYDFGVAKVGYAFMLVSVHGAGTSTGN